VFLMIVELSTSQDFVRHFFTDIEGPVPFFAVNTTLSVFLLWSTALLFLVCFALFGEAVVPLRLRWFYASQVVVFAFLGFDDRFKVHERIGMWFDIGDHYVLAAVAIAQCGFLTILGGRTVLHGAALKCLGLASVLFTVMLVVDAKFPHDLVLRLSLEDLAKTWACLFFLLFAWNHLSGQIQPILAVYRRAPGRNSAEDSDGGATNADHSHDDPTASRKSEYSLQPSLR
jgi:hypothetical protein